MSKNLKVYGLSEDDYSALQQVAVERYGKENVSQLARDILLEQIDRPLKPVSYRQTTSANINQNLKKRTILRLNAAESQYFQTAATQHEMSINGFIRAVLQKHMSGHPTLSRAEVDALYQSNYQLLRIGRNLNQIARQLNAMESVEFSSRHVESLLKIINEHTVIVGKMITAARERQAT